MKGKEINEIDRVPTLKELSAGALVYYYRPSAKDRNQRNYFRYNNDKIYDKIQSVKKKGGDDIAKLLLVIRRCGHCHQFRNWEKVGGVIVETRRELITRCSLCLSLEGKYPDIDPLSLLQACIQMHWGQQSQHDKHKKKPSRNK